MERLDRSRAGWNILAQQIPMAKLDRFAGPERRFSMDKWDGYEQSRSAPAALPWRQENPRIP